LKPGTNDRYRIVWAMPWRDVSARCFDPGATIEMKRKI
jgi:hypothetical protein